jgi:hypothetical protein
VYREITAGEIILVAWVKTGAWLLTPAIETQLQESSTLI